MGKSSVGERGGVTGLWIRVGWVGEVRKGRVLMMAGHERVTTDSI